MFNFKSTQIYLFSKRFIKWIKLLFLNFLIISTVIVIISFVKYVSFTQGVLRFYLD